MVLGCFALGGASGVFLRLWEGRGIPVSSVRCCSGTGRRSLRCGMHWFSDSVTCPLALTVDMHVIIVVSRPPRWVPCQSPTYHPKKRNTTQETSAGPSSTPSCVRRPSPQGEARGLPPAASHTSRPLMPWLAVRGLVTARPRLDGWWRRTPTERKRV